MICTHEPDQEKMRNRGAKHDKQATVQLVSKPCQLLLWCRLATIPSSTTLPPQTSKRVQPVPFKRKAVVRLPAWRFSVGPVVLCAQATLQRREIMNYDEQKVRAEIDELVAFALDEGLEGDITARMNQQARLLRWYTEILDRVLIFAPSDIQTKVAWLRDLRQWLDHPRGPKPYLSLPIPRMARITMDRYGNFWLGERLLQEGDELRVLADGGTHWLPVQLARDWQGRWIWIWVKTREQYTSAGFQLNDRIAKWQTHEYASN